MAEICPVCGLPKDLCVCGVLSKEQQKIRVRRDTRKWGKPVTLIDGVDQKSVDIGRLAQRMKAYCACGGTAKNGEIMLQGDHRSKAREFLVKEGFPPENIEVG